MTHTSNRAWLNGSPLSDTEDQDQDAVSVTSDDIGGGTPKRGVCLLRVVGNIQAFESQRSHLDVLQLVRKIKRGTHQTDARWDLRVIEKPNWQVEYFTEWCNEMLAGCQSNMRFYACDDLANMDLTSATPFKFETGEPDLTQSSVPSLAASTATVDTIGLREHELEQEHEPYNLYAMEGIQDDSIEPLALGHFASPRRLSDPAAAAAIVDMCKPIPSAPNTSAATTPNSSPQRKKRKSTLEVSLLELEATGAR